MKLIDILVQALPKRGGWPDGKGVSSHGPGDTVIFHELGQPPYCMAGLTFTGNDIVTKEEYEASLAASKQVWNGEGLPPVGCRVETRFNGEWVEATVAYTGRPESSGAADTCKWKEALVFDCKTTRPFWADEFRPIRSEADKKRDEVVAKLTDAICGEVTDTGMATAANYAVRAYDAIAAGKIPHISIK